MGKEKASTPLVKETLGTTSIRKHAFMAQIDGICRPSSRRPVMPLYSTQVNNNLTIEAGAMHTRKPSDSQRKGGVGESTRRSRETNRRLHVSFHQRLGESTLPAGGGSAVRGTSGTSAKVPVQPHTLSNFFKTTLGSKIGPRKLH